MQADGIRDAFYCFSYIHTKQLFLWEGIKSCSRPCVDFFFWQIQDELKKQCEKKCFFQAVVPSFIWESENLRKQKTILLQLQLCGKSQKTRIIK